MIDLTTYALLRKQITTAASGVSDVRAEGDELVFVLADGHEVRVAIPATEIRDAVVRDDVLVLTLEDDKEVVVDATLTQNGQAADAKATGEAVNQLKDDMTEKADKAALTRTDRSLDALWKLNQGISYDFQTDAAAAYAKHVPSGAKLADVQSVGGKTVVWNQPVQYTSSTSNKNGISITLEGKHASIVVENPTNHNQVTIGKVKLIRGHKYITLTNKAVESGIEVYFTGKSGIRNGRYAIETPDERYLGNQGAYVFVGASVANGTYEYDVSIFDLTQLFGSGNEPTDISDSRIAWIEQYAAAHPEYNAGELVSADVESVVARGRNIWGGNAIRQSLEKFGIDASGNDVQVKGESVYKQMIYSITPKANTQYTFILTSRMIDGNFTNKSSSNFTFIYDDGTREPIYMIRNNNVSTIKTTSNVDKTLIGIYGDYQIGGKFRFNPDKTGLFEGDITIDEYTEYINQTVAAIPSTVRALPGYGWSTGSVANAIERTESGWRYVQRVGSRAYQDGDVITDGVHTYYELAEPIITDITEEMLGVLEPFDVEGGGAITFENNAKLPVPSSVEYIVSLAEVGV